MAITRQPRLLLWRLLILLAISGIVAGTVFPDGRPLVLWIAIAMMACTPAILGAVAIRAIVRSINDREVKRRAELPARDRGGDAK